MNESDPRAEYDKDQAFDLETGMAVYGAAGDRIGHVTAVEGFGSTRLGIVPTQGRDDRVTQAQSATGYFTVNQEDALGKGAADLVVPFSGIEQVTAGHGVTLKVSARRDSPAKHDGTGFTAGEPTEPQPSWWQKWLPGKKR